MRDNLPQPGIVDQHASAGNPLLSFRIAPDLEAAIHACAAALGMTHTEWARNVLQQAVLQQNGQDPDARFIEEFEQWWTSRGRGDLMQIYGAKMRAKGLGMTFPWKLRMFIKQGLDHALL